MIGGTMVRLTVVLFATCTRRIDAPVRACVHTQGTNSYVLTGTEKGMLETFGRRVGVFAQIGLF
jgi:hypothetical protein